MGIILSCFSRKKSRQNDQPQSHVLIRPLVDDDNTDKARYTLVFDENKGCRRIVRTAPIPVPNVKGSYCKKNYREAIKVRLEKKIQFSKRETKEDTNYPTIDHYIFLSDSDSSSETEINPSKVERNLVQKRLPSKVNFY